MAGVRITALPDFGKIMAANLAILLGTALFDAGRLPTFRPRLIDLPIAAWFICPFFSSLINGLGAYDGASSVFGNVMTWGIPYLIGRLYFSDLPSLRELAIAIFIGGLIYVPFCLWEIRMSPQLHAMIYGGKKTGFIQTIRYGGYRPVVFMQHGLMVSMWLTTATLAGWSLWRSGNLRHLFGVPIAWLLPLLIVTTVLCKSTYALVLLFLGIVVMSVCKRMHSAVPLMCLIMVVPTYMVLRSQNILAVDTVTSIASEIFPEDRVRSLSIRLEQEDVLSARAMQRPLFGWGGWGRSSSTDPVTGQPTLKGLDALWTITLGSSGIIGIASFTMTMLLAPFLVLWRRPGRFWSDASSAPLMVMVTLLVLHMLDNLLNGMINPIFPLIASGLGGYQRV